MLASYLTQLLRSLKIALRHSSFLFPEACLSLSHKHCQTDFFVQTFLLRTRWSTLDSITMSILRLKNILVMLQHKGKELSINRGYGI